MLISYLNEDKSKLIFKDQELCSPLYEALEAVNQLVVLSIYYCPLNTRPGKLEWPLKNLTYSLSFVASPARHLLTLIYSGKECWRNCFWNNCSLKQNTEGEAGEGPLLSLVLLYIFSNPKHMAICNNHCLNPTSSQHDGLLFKLIPCLLWVCISTQNQLQAIKKRTKSLREDYFDVRTFKHISSHCILQIQPSNDWSHTDNGNYRKFHKENVTAAAWRNLE